MKNRPKKQNIPNKDFLRRAHRHLLLTPANQRRQTETDGGARAKFPLGYSRGAAYLLILNGASTPLFFTKNLKKSMMKVWRLRSWRK
ncbi:hypothetical protein CO134_01475 [Candidatus Kuenenbacteria bacterium CG_4_9_14_3_um_filter_39_14]|uniref:Uncharacterized protein n=2 Tax=Candidatus Kueneniibacteriota TaxID=1752740 RepID=A0A2M7Z9G3_9BACT|nr:MAG: hypothetical protein AUK13_01755 [Candidatus Kuenenbacteria bacterium CG2_30_39_24]PJA92179.1 MAG: hypothetical protein CO134_01475 [Candidatus Kuenenbacteria bacterium CG_4_9_14_3_um_filter_39_14]